MSNESTHFLTGLDVSREYGLVIDYHYNRSLRSHLETLLSLCNSPDMTTYFGNDAEQQRTGIQRPVASQALSTKRCNQYSRAQEKGTFSFESSTFHLREEESEHEHKYTSTSEDYLVKLLGMPEHSKTWTRFDKRAKTYRTTSSSGPLWENVIARITIDDKTGHIMSLENTKHTNEKDLYRNLPFVRDIRTLLLHCSPVTPNQQLKQSFQTFAALPVDETRH